MREPSINNVQFLFTDILSQNDHIPVILDLTRCCIYYYLFNQCLSPLTLWVRTPLRRGVLDETLCDKVCQWLAPGPCFSTGFRFLLPIKLTATMQLKYCWKWCLTPWPCTPRLSGVRTHNVSGERHWLNR
jgi:hypothetical protein